MREVVRVGRGGVQLKQTGGHKETMSSFVEVSDNGKPDTGGRVMFWIGGGRSVVSEIGGERGGRL